jgi:hypothetical protein
MSPGFGIVALKIAAMDHLFHPILEFKNQSRNDIGLALTIFFCILTLLLPFQFRTMLTGPPFCGVSPRGNRGPESPVAITEASS